MEDLPPDVVEPDKPSRARLPMWTGPPGDERAYRIDDPRRYRRGGLGVVFEAVICSESHGPELLGAPVGLKQLTGIDDERWQKLMERSARLAQVKHPGLSRHLGAFVGSRPWRDGREPDDDDDPQRYIVHLWVEGRPLADALDTDPGTILGWLRQVAEGLDHLHTHPAGPFAHRDLHPRNIIVNAGGNAVVIDFDTVFAGDTWTTTRTLRGSRFALSSDPSVSPQAADRSALAKVALHALAGDGDGALGDDEVLEAAAASLRAHSVAPERAVALLKEASAGGGPATCRKLVDQLAEAVRDPSRDSRRRIRLVAGNAGGLNIRRTGIVLMLLLLAVGSIWLFTPGPGRPAPGPGSASTASGLSPSTSSVSPSTSSVSPPGSSLSPPTSGISPPTSGISPPTSSVSPPTSSAVFADTFSDPSTGWPNAQVTAKNAAYYDNQGGYRIRIPGISTNLAVSPRTAGQPALTALSAVGVNTSSEVDVKFVSSSPARAGPSCRVQPATNDRYQALITASGNWQISSDGRDQSYVVLVSGMTTLPETAGVYHVRFECRSDGTTTTLRLEVGETLIREWTGQGGWTSGGVGLAVYSDKTPAVEVLFDNFLAMKS